MNKTLLTAALLSFAVATPAMAETPKTSFTLDGVTYTYTVKDDGETKVIDGKASPGKSFHYVVRGKAVTGFVNGMRVSFQVPAEPAKVAQNVTLSTR